MDIKEELFVAQQQLIGLAALQVQTSAGKLAEKPSTASLMSKSTKSRSNTNDYLNAKPISFQSIVDAVNAPQLTTSTSTLMRVNASAAGAKTYQLLLAHLAHLSSPALAAASSSDKINRRQAKGFEIRLCDDPDNQAQAFVLLTLTQMPGATDTETRDFDINVSQSVHLHIELQEQFFLLHFSHPYKNSFQTIISKTSLEYLAIVEADAQLYITAS